VTPSNSETFTQLLVASQNGDQSALNRVMPQVYNELRRLAGSYLRRERANHTLQGTALVHEAYIRLVDQRQMTWHNRAQFFGIASQMIRRILVDHARRTQAKKRGEGGVRLSLEDAPEPGTEPGDISLIDLDEALSRLAALDEQQSRIVEMRYFGGLSIEETAEALKISTATVKRDWTIAKAWLYQQLGA
jgi:RNA polymerase sigma factor (TIGR02999 family)